MMYTRYSLAADLAHGKRTLEIGCASGLGLGLLLSAASFVVGGDVFLPMLKTARRHYADRVSLAQFSATNLPFRTASFDFVLFMEATYYISDFERALDEIDRVLDRHGLLLFVNANPERPDFIRSPHSTHYHSAAEFRHMLGERGYDVETSGGFATSPDSTTPVSRRLMGRLFRWARNFAERLHLVPRTLAGRARIKRLIFGRLKKMPAELPTSFAAREILTPLADSSAKDYKVIYIVARRTIATQRNQPHVRQAAV